MEVGGILGGVGLLGGLTTGGTLLIGGLLFAGGGGLADTPRCEHEANKLNIIIRLSIRNNLFIESPYSF